VYDVHLPDAGVADKHHFLRMVPHQDMTETHVFEWVGAPS
jgi:hypothetical protein